jgi:small subunit ribosomal protein S20
LKRHRQSQKRTARNHAQKSAVRTAVKKARAAAESGNAPEAAALIKQAQVALARAGVKGVFHKRGVSRKISRLALLQNRIGQGASSVAQDPGHKKAAKGSKSTKPARRSEGPAKAKK